jgi:hypothetical protein
MLDAGAGDGSLEVNRSELFDGIDGTRVGPAAVPGERRYSMRLCPDEFVLIVLEGLTFEGR